MYSGFKWLFVFGRSVRFVLVSIYLDSIGIQRIWVYLYMDTSFVVCITKKRGKLDFIIWVWEGEGYSRSSARIYVCIIGSRAIEKFRGAEDYRACEDCMGET